MGMVWTVRSCEVARRLLGSATPRRTIGLPSASGKNSRVRAASSFIRELYRALPSLAIKVVAECLRREAGQHSCREPFELYPTHAPMTPIRPLHVLAEITNVEPDRLVS